MEAKLHLTYNTQPEKTLSACAQGIIKTMLYFDIFSYPLSAKEIFMNHGKHQLSHEEFYDSLDLLLEKKMIFCIDGFYCLHNNPTFVERRSKGNIMAKRYLKYARWVTALVSQVPFVRHISLSGSISKGYMEKSSDIDYFIITSPGRLWLARTIMVLLKTFLFLNSHKLLCINYFIDENHLEIKEKNIFTAREIAYLAPMYNSCKFGEFNLQNAWTNIFLPNFEHGNENILENDTLFKKLMERLFKGKLGDWLDSFCMDLTLSFWKKKHKGTMLTNSIRCHKWEAKYHPRYYQGKILHTFDEKLADFEKAHKIAINK